MQLVHRVFGEFVADAASIQPLPDTFDFVLEACALVADFYPDESIRQQLFSRHLEQYLGKPIYRVNLTSGVSATDGSIVDKLEKPEVTAPCCKPSMMSSTRCTGTMSTSCTLCTDDMSIQCFRSSGQADGSPVLVH